MEMALNIQKCVDMVHGHVMKYSEMAGMHVLKQCERCPKVHKFRYSHWECRWHEMLEYSQNSEKYLDSSDLQGQTPEANLGAVELQLPLRRLTGS